MRILGRAWEDHRRLILGGVALTWILLVGLTYFAISRKDSTRAVAKSSSTQTLKVGGLPVT